MKKVFTILLTAFLICLLCACSNKAVVTMERAERVPSTGSSWTILVYMCGSDMESQKGEATKCLEAMRSIDYPENINVVVETGGSKEWHTNGIYSDYLQRFEMQKGSMLLADQTASADMGNYRTFRDFLQWGIKAYPANHYMAVVYNHGGGSMTGTAFDELFENDCLNLEELSYAISLSGVKFDIIGFDASLMGNLETASALSQYGDYMIAPAEYSPASWNYAEAIQCIIDNPDADTGEISKVVCDAAYHGYDERTAEIASVAVTDLTKISTLAQSFDGLAGVMLTAADGLANCAHLQRNLQYTHIYGANSLGEGYTNMVDLGNLASIVQENTGTTSDLLGQILNETVIYVRNGKYHDGASGLGVFYPLDNSPETVDRYMEISISNNYNRYLKSVVIDPNSQLTNDYHSSWAWLDYNNEIQNFANHTSVNEDNYYELGLEGNMDIIKSVGVDIYHYNNDNNGVYAHLYRDSEPDSQWDSGLFTYDLKKIPMLNGKLVTMDFIGWGGAYKIYSIPVIINGDKSNIRIAYNPENGDYEILGSWRGIDPENGKSDRYLRKLKLFDRITPVFNTNEGGYVLGKPFTVGFNGVKISEKTPETGKYMLEYDVRDIYGNKLDVNSVLVDKRAAGKSMHQ